ncbi:MAG: hypothetical protein PVF74_01615 [Anaerolineales bacterium]
MENRDKQDNNQRWLLILATIIIVLLMIGIGLLAFYLLRDSPQPEPTSLPDTATPTQVPPTEPAPAEVQPTQSTEILFQSYAVDRDRILAGECVNISWVVEGADLIQLQRDGVLVLDQAPPSHTYQACLDNPGIYIYRLEAGNAAHSNWIELQVIIDPGTQAPPDSGGEATLPPTTGQVTVQAFFVEPQRIQVGECATIQWEVLNADQIQLLRDEVVVVPNGQLQDSFTDCHNQAAIYRYRLEAKNSDNFYSVLELQVIVDP